MPLAPDGSALEQALARWHRATYPTVNLWRVAGSGSLVVTGLLFLLFFYRRRLYILFWTGGWLLVSASMFLAARPIVHENKVTLMSVRRVSVSRDLSALLRDQPMPTCRSRACVAATRLSCSRCCSGLRSRRWRSIPGRCSPGHVLIAGALAAAGVGHLTLLRQVRMLGAAVVGISFLLIAGSHVWVILRVASPGTTGTTSSLASASCSTCSLRSACS